MKLTLGDPHSSSRATSFAQAEIAAIFETQKFDFPIERAALRVLFFRTYDGFAVTLLFRFIPHFSDAPCVAVDVQHDKVHRVDYHEFFLGNSLLRSSAGSLVDADRFAGLYHRISALNS